MARALALVAMACCLALGAASHLRGNDATLQFYQGGPHRCASIVIAGGTSNPFWAPHGYQYKNWATGPCPTRYNRVTAVHNAVSGYAGVTLTDYEVIPTTVEADAPFEAKTLHLTETDGRHCTMLQVPGTKVGKSFWMDMAWRYNAYTEGACSAKFNIVNSQVKNMAGFVGVDLTTKGINVSEETKATFAIMNYVVPEAEAKVAHCLEFIIPVANAKKFVDAMGWEFPGMAKGNCPARFNVVNSRESNQFNLGVSIVRKGIHTKPVKGPLTQDEEAAIFASGNVMVISSLTNPRSPRGQQHCQQLSVPGGKASKFWAAEGWRYTSPPWVSGGCPSYFNYENRILHNLAGFTGVTWEELGVSEQ